MLFRSDAPLTDLKAVKNRIVVPASSTSSTASLEAISLSISCVSLASDRLSNFPLLPASALIMIARLLMLFDDGKLVTTPLIRSVLYKVIFELKLSYVRNDVTEN